MFNSPTIKDKKYYTLRDRNKMGERLESASEHVLASASKNKEEPRPLSLQSCNACTTKKELKRTPSPQQSMASRCTTSSQARRAQLELEAAKAKAKIQLDLIDKQLQVDIAMINDGDGSTQSRCSDFDPARTQEAVQDWMSKSMQPLDCPDPAAATTTAPEPALAAKVSESSRAPDPGPPVDSIVYLAETLKQIMTATPSQQDNRLLTRLSTPRELPTFDGDCIEWLHFKSAFKESTKICNYSDAENIWRLRRALKGQAKEAVTDLLIGNSPPNSVMEALELRFGRADIVVQHLTMQIRKLPSLPLNYQQDLINFSIKVNNCVAALRAIDQYDYLSSPELLSSLTSKLPSPLLSRWMDYAFKNRDLNESKLQLLASFLKHETDKMAVVGIIQPCEQKKAEPFLHTKKIAFYKSRHNDNKHTVFATTSFNVDQKCNYCKKSAHLLPDCRIFKRAMRKDRWRYAKSNGLCFCCLLDRHDNNICPAPVCDINNCGRAHHKLLHFNRLTPPSTIRASTCDSDHDEPAAPAAAKESSTVAHVHTAPVSSEVHGTQRHSSITVPAASHVAVKVVKVQLYGPRVVMHKDKEDIHGHRREHSPYDHVMPDGEMFLQALNGFLMILTCEGEVFFATHSIESYLGFHQSDIVHQSVYELVHSEDREELQRQILWNSFLPPEVSNLSLQDVLRPERAHLLERSFTVRFRCLLDNTSGFLRLDIRGRIKILHGQNKKTEEPPLALFAICAPFGPPSLLEIPQKEVMFKSKHKLDLSLVSMDQRGKMLLGYTDAELANMGGYDLVHYDDLAYVASAHQELLKTGASGMIAYRFQTKDGQWQWLQTSSRLVYKNSKPDFVISTHRPLMEEEGRDLLGKRTMDFKVSYLDTGLTSLYFSETEQLSGCETTVTTPPRAARRYKTQLRDFLSTCRNKRRVPTTPAPPPVDYLAADAVAAAYTNLNGAYTASYGEYPPAPIHYAPPPLDDRFLTADNLFHQYKPLSYHYTPYAPNGFLEPAPPPGYEVAPTYHRPPSREYTYIDSSGRYMSPVAGQERRSPSVVPGPSPAGSSGSAEQDRMQQNQTAEMPRQTVLMWGAGGTAQEVPVEYSPPQVWRYHPSHYHTAEATQ